jgi:hypothetical protein
MCFMCHWREGRLQSRIACGTKEFRFLRKRTISASTSAVVDIGDDSARRDRGARPATPSL